MTHAISLLSTLTILITWLLIPGEAGVHSKSKVVAADANQLGFHPHLTNAYQFGRVVAINDKTAVIGASGCSTQTIRQCGCAYVFEYDPILDSWNQTAKLVASDAGPYQFFGFGVSVFGDYIHVGTMNAQRTYLFKRNETNPYDWYQLQILQVTSPGQHGMSVAITETQAVACDWYGQVTGICT